MEINRAKEIISALAEGIDPITGEVLPDDSVCNKGEIWKFEDELYPLIQKCMALMSDNPLFLIVNSYTSNVSSTIVKNVLELTIKKRFGGYVTDDEITLSIKGTNMYLPCGAATRWIND